jgi:hypothetical protein
MYLNFESRRYRFRGLPTFDGNTVGGASWCPRGVAVAMCKRRETYQVDPIPWEGIIYLACGNTPS